MAGYLIVAALHLLYKANDLFDIVLMVASLKDFFILLKFG
jgi:hypothetical protein